MAQQTHIGSARLQAAQDAAGLSNEAIARVVPVSEKTWRRWKKSGAVPTAAIPAVAKALRLELRELDPKEADDRLERMEEELRQVQDGLAAVPEIRAALARIEALLLAEVGAAQST